MLHRFIDNPDYKSRFRILKGGKISLVVSALLVSSSVMLNAGTTTISDANTSQQSFDGNTTSLDITSTGSVTTTAGDAITTTGNLANNNFITVNGNISATETGNTIVSAIDINGTIDNGSYITNSGNIDANTTGSTSIRGIYVKSDMNGTITNNTGATISAESNNSGAAFAIRFNNGTEINSSLVNSGTIKATAASNKAYSVYLGGNSYGTVTNNAGAVISAESNSSAIGIIYSSMKTNSSLVNSGTIKATSASRSYAILLASPMYGTITNNAGAIISAESNSGIAHSISLNSDMKTNSSLVNSGIIKAKSISGYARGIYLYDHMYGTVTNNAEATISAESNSREAYGIYFRSGMEINSSLINSGTIIANSISGSANSIYLGSAMDGNITNNGTITATKNSLADKFSYSIDEDSVSNDGTILNSSTGKLYGNILVQGAGLFTNSGLISLPYNANGAISARIDEFNQTSTGILQIGLNTASDGNVTNNYSKLTTVNATFASGSIIDVNVLTADGNQGFLVGETLANVVSASTDLNISGTLNITDNSALLNFEYVEDGNTIDLNVVSGSTIEDSVTSGGGSSSTQKAGAILGNGDPAFNGVVGELNALATDKEVARAVESTTPVVGASNQGASTQVANGITSIINSRQNTTSGSGLNSGEALLSDKNVWIKPYVSFGSQNDKDGISGFGLRASGFGIGVDGEYDTKQRVGVAFFYTKAKVDTNNVSQNSELDILNLLVYGSMPLIDDKTTLLYQVGYGRQETSSSRNIFNSTTAKADYTTQTASLDLQLMKDFQINDNFVVEPTLGTTYRYTNTPSYTESGAGVLNLSTNKFTANDFTANAGVLTNYKVSKDISLLANANLRYDINNQTSSVTSAYAGSAGATFSTNGIDNGRLNYELGTGVNMQEILGGEISFMYDYQAKGSDFSNNIFSAKYLVRF